MAERNVSDVVSARDWVPSEFMMGERRIVDVPLLSSEKGGGCWKKEVEVLSCVRWRLDKRRLGGVPSRTAQLVEGGADLMTNGEGADQPHQDWRGWSLG
jgi:hypothetical protein